MLTIESIKDALKEGKTLHCDAWLFTEFTVKCKLGCCETETYETTDEVVSELLWLSDDLNDVEILEDYDQTSSN